MKKIKVNITFLLLAVLVVGCWDKKPTTFYYQINTMPRLHQYKIVKIGSVDTADFYRIHRNLDTSFRATEQTLNSDIDTLTTLINDSSVHFFTHHEFLKDRIVGKKHTYTYTYTYAYTYDTMLVQFEASTCLLRNVSDTIIHGNFYKSCGIYNVVKGGMSPYNVTFDWENRVDVEDIDPQTKAYVRLVKIE